MKISFLHWRENFSMQAANTPCSLEHTIDAPAIEAPEALPPREEDAATHGAPDIRPAPSNVLSIKDEILRLADHGLCGIPVHIKIDARGKKRRAKRAKSLREPAPVPSNLQAHRHRGRLGGAHWCSAQCI